MIYYILIGWPIFTYLFLRLLYKETGSITLVDIIFSLLICLVPIIRELIIIGIYGSDIIIWERK